jgi:hypothetical protein
MSGQAEVTYASPSLRILEMTAPVGIRLIGHLDLSDRDGLGRVLKRTLSVRRDLYIDLSKLDYADVGGMSFAGSGSASRSRTTPAPRLHRGGGGSGRPTRRRGDDDRRAAWVRLTMDIGADTEQLTGFRLGWPPVFDGLLALHRNDAAAAMRRLSADIEVLGLFHHVGAGGWRPWYAALWAEAAVLDHHPTAAARVEQSRHAARDNPIATAMVERAAVITTGDRETLARLAITFARLGCPYQQARTARMAAGPLAQG